MVYKLHINLDACFVFSPLALAGVFLSTRLGHTVQSLLQEVFSECLSHLGQRIHCKSTNKPLIN